jgi:hypothetical protein
MEKRIESGEREDRSAEVRIFNISERPLAE